MPHLLPHEVERFEQIKAAQFQFELLKVSIIDNKIFKNASSRIPSSTVTETGILM